jgi:hypothetical protein
MPDNKKESTNKILQSTTFLIRRSLPNICIFSLFAKIKFLQEGKDLSLSSSNCEESIEVYSITAEMKTSELFDCIDSI